jgi:hypothetical protein
MLRGVQAGICSTVLLATFSCSIFSRFARKNRGNCTQFEPSGSDLAPYVGLFLQPPAHHISSAARFFNIRG